MYKIIPLRKIWLSLSAILVTLSIVAIAVWGLNFGLDFTGGSLLELKFHNQEVNISQVKEALAPLELKSLVVQSTENDTVLLRFQDSTEDIHREVVSALETSYGIDNNIEDEDITGQASIEELRFDAVGPSIGEELKDKSINAMILVLIIIVVYISLVFKKVSKPVSSWKYGIVAIIALFHDIIITLGIFAVLGEFMNLEINTPFVAAILTVLGYSVNDTIIVFDRIRENLPKQLDNFSKTVNRSVNQTITRSINTSTTTLLVLLSILFLGGESIKEFILALAIGVLIGTYSSIFLASPLLVVWNNITHKQKED
ncbi:protein translocase subunit SecF [Patescibacteria group bacterium]|nr:protein translocase subunit SecF [Patescibacteria group bacterium]